MGDTTQNKCHHIIENGIAIITIDNPPMNALNHIVLQDLRNSVNALIDNAAVRVIIITGAGKAFVAGADINEIKVQNTKEDGANFLKNGQEIYNIIENADKPFIAAINGYCLGGGLELALACHIRLADESAQVGLPEIKLGIIPGYGGTQRSPRLFGKAAAYELILSGNFISGKQAETYRIVNIATQKGTVLDEAQELAKAIAARSRLAIKAAMQAIAQGYTMEFYTALTFERELFGKLCETEDKKEGIAAFLEKREPQFKDK